MTDPTPTPQPEGTTVAPLPTAESPTYTTVTTPTENTAGELERLRAENAAMRRVLDSRGIDPPVIGPPSFGMSEGTRQELQATGKATNPWGGGTLTREDAPDGVDVSPAERGAQVAGDDVGGADGTPAPKGRRAPKRA